MSGNPSMSTDAGRRAAAGRAVRRRLAATIAVAMALIVDGGAAAPTFVDVTAAAGIRFTHRNGAFGQKYLPETLGSGVVVFDADGDGRPDLYFANGTRWPGRPGGASLPALYHNRGGGQFADVTRGSGLDVENYGMGGAAADFDNDGRADLYVTALGGNRLFRGLGGGRFADVTAKAGVGDGGFSTGAIWFDYDKDGRLDLFVAHYVEWTEKGDIHCTLDGKAKSYCTPESYKGQSGTLFRNRGDGTFENVTRKAGLFDAAAKGLGVAMLDYDADGWMDLFVSNDTQPNRLYRNRRDGTFVDVAVAAGVAFSEAGMARAGMGVDAADYDGSGRPSLIIGNFSNEMMAVYHNEGKGLFIDDAPRSAIGRATLLTLTFGCFFFDYDLDGAADIFAVNGHVADDIEKVQSRVTYRQRPHLFRNAGQGKFEETTAASGPALGTAMVARGAAYGDFDDDGDPDVVISTSNGPARLLRNDGDATTGVLRVKTTGVVSNRDGIGAHVQVTVAGRPRWQIVKTGSSYLSQSELPLTFGLGRAAAADEVRVTWPSGKVDVATHVAANRQITIREGSGIVETQPIVRRGGTAAGSPAPVAAPGRRP